jgi:hypothetical protein
MKIHQSPGGARIWLVSYEYSGTTRHCSTGTVSLAGSTALPLSMAGACCRRQVEVALEIPFEFSPKWLITKLSITVKIVSLGHFTIFGFWESTFWKSAKRLYYTHNHLILLDQRFQILKLYHLNLSESWFEEIWSSYEMLSGCLFSIFLVGIEIWISKISSYSNSKISTRISQLFGINRVIEDRKGYENQIRGLDDYGISSSWSFDPSLLDKWLLILLIIWKYRLFTYFSIQTIEIHNTF